MRSHTAILHIGHRTFKGFVINDVYSNIEITSKVLYLIEAYCDLITGSSLSMKIQIMGGKIWVSNPCSGRSKFFWYSKMVKNKDMQFFMENFKWKEKTDKKFFDLPERGFEPRIFSNFHGKWGAQDQIKTSF